MAADLDGETVLLDTQSGRYFGLNAVGTRVWALANESRSVKDMVSVLSSEYEVPPAQLEQDVLNFLNSLEQRGLVHVVTHADV